MFTYTQGSGLLYDNFGDFPIFVLEPDEFDSALEVVCMYVCNRECM